MAEEPKDTLWGHVLHKVGLTEHLRRFKFGGFVGKLFIFGATAVTVMGAVSFKLHGDWFVIAALTIMGLIVWLVIRQGSAFANKHPELALLEGAQILQREQMHLAAKGVSIPVIAEAPIPDPNPKLLDATNTPEGEQE